MKPFTVYAICRLHSDWEGGYITGALLPGTYRTLARATVVIKNLPLVDADAFQMVRLHVEGLRYLRELN